MTNPIKKTPGSRSHNNAGQFAQEDKNLKVDLKVKVDVAKFDQIEVVATDYNVLLTANDCLPEIL